MKVLIVEDDRAVRGLVHSELTKCDIDVTSAADGASARRALRTTAFNLVILDLTLPDGSGLDVLASLTDQDPKPHVIILSGASAEADRVNALRMGADDYVVKPFFTRELTQRVLAVRRREDAAADTHLQFGYLEIDLTARRVTVEGSIVELALKEFDLLAFLASRPGHVFSRDELLRSVWQSAADLQQPSTVTEHMRRLRAKIEHDPAHPALLATARGVGYRFDAPRAAEGLSDPHRDELVSAYLIHVDLEIVFADEAARSMMRPQSGADLVGSNVLELFTPASMAAAVARGDAAVASGRQPRSQVLAVRVIDGSDISVEVMSSDTEWQGRPARRLVIAPATDKSTRLRHLFTGLFSELSDAVIVTDVGANIRSWNNAAERLYGWREDEVLGRHIVDVVPWVSEDVQLGSTWAALEVSGRWHGRGEQLARDGSRVTVLASTTLVRDEAGEPLGIVSINRTPAGARDAKTVADEADERALRRGLARNELDVYFQPVVDLSDRSIVAVEALVRWLHPTRGLLEPAAFLGVAERSGLILELGDAVLEKACRQAAAWRAGGAAVEVAVNLSTQDLADPRLVDRVASALSSTGLDANALWLEVTETALVEDVDEASRLLHRLAHRGVRIAIDDFGTGWASLTYLSQFPVHALKIDRAFVAGMARSPRDTAIVRSIFELGRELGLVVIPEGIETIEQQRALQALGCVVGQGYLYGRPTAAVDVPIEPACRRVSTTAEQHTSHTELPPSKEK